MFTGLGSFLVALHQLAFAVEIGFDKLYAAEVLGLGAFLSLPGVIITGTMSDYIGRELSAVVTYGTSIIGVACAMLITVAGPASAAVAACLLLRPDLGRTRAGDHRQDGRSVSGTATGHDPRGDHDRHGDRLGGPVVAGWLVFDVTGSYQVAFGLSIFFYVCGSVAFWALRRPPVAEC